MERIEQEAFIKLIAPIIRYKAFMRGYKFPSAIIAQACLESRYGASKLSAEYHNYFGLKCGAYWSGDSVNLATKEEYVVGTFTSIKDNFRVYPSMEAGVDGYFDFINTTRYNNLKTASGPIDYLKLIKADGYATSNNYVENVYSVIEKFCLAKYDWPTQPDLNMAIDTIANYVIAKYFGNGHDTRKELIYELIRARVNEKCKGA